MSPILPPATLGFISGGQLGRMLALAARQLGYGVAVWDTSKNSPAGQIADRVFVAPFDDAATARAFAAACAVVIVEWENIPLTLLQRLEKDLPVFCASALVALSQDRAAEKNLFTELRIPTPRFCVMHAAADVATAIETVGLPAIFKTTRGGYDGKGQVRVGTAEEVAAAFAALGQHSPVIAEELISFQKEISVVAARGADGSFVTLPIGENEHRGGVLYRTTVPAGIAAETAAAAIAATRLIAETQQVVGVFAVEFFVLQDGSIVANEIAPRVHNSGHWSQAGASVSQFELAIRAACGLPFSAPQLTAGGVVMQNILGGDDFEQAIKTILKNSELQLHLYGKTENRAGRKMAHVIATGESAEAAAEKLAQL